MSDGAIEYVTPFSPSVWGGFGTLVPRRNRFRNTLIPTVLPLANPRLLTASTVFSKMLAVELSRSRNPAVTFDGPFEVAGNVSESGDWVPPMKLYATSELLAPWMNTLWLVALKKSWLP